LLRGLERVAPALLKGKRRLSRLGSDRGGMFVTIDGRGRDGAAKRIAWNLIARRGDGPFIPAIASAVIAQRLARGEESRRGAMPCFELITLDEFDRAVADLDIGWTVERA
jgi:hypothetical protein